MKNYYNLILLMSIFLMSSDRTQAQALNWLSQPDVDVPKVLNGESNLASISANGQYLAFISSASNIVAGDDNQRSDLFIYDRINDSVQRYESPLFSARFRELSPTTSDGRFIVVTVTIVFDRYVYLLDTQNGQFTLENIDSNGDRFQVFDHIYLADDGNTVILSTQANLSPLHTNSDVQIYAKNLSNDQFRLLSLSSDGSTAANDFAFAYDVSANGRYVALGSIATNLRPDLTLNSRNNLFVLDLDDNSYSLASIKPDGQPSIFSQVRFDGVSVSNSGQVAYISNAPDLVNNDNNNVGDLFLFNNTQNVRINLDSNDQELANGIARSNAVIISPDDSIISYSSFSDLITTNDDNQTLDTFIYHINDDITVRASSTPAGIAANDRSTPSAVSADGQTVILLSAASDLGQGNNDTRLMRQIYVYDVANQQVTASLPQPAFDINIATFPVLGSQISADQRYAFYVSNSPYLSEDTIPETSFNLSSVPQTLFMLDRETGTHHVIARKISSGFDVSPSGRFVVFSSAFFQPQAQAGFGSLELFVYDRDYQSYTQLISGRNPQVNDAGMVVFTTNQNIAAEDNNNTRDVYLYDPSNNSFQLVNRTTSGITSNSGAFSPFISGAADNVWVGFASFDSDYIDNDTNGRIDAFMYQWPDGQTIRINQRPDGTADNDGVSGNSIIISDDAAYVLFASFGTNLTDDDYSGADSIQLFVYETATKNINLITRQGPNGAPFEEGMRINGFDLSNSGRFISYSVPGSLNFFNDGFPADDVFLYDQQNNSTELVSRFLSGLQVRGNSNQPRVVEDLSVSPPLVGVVFNGAAELTQIENHSGHAESFLYQQGGPNVQLNIAITGTGSVNGSFGISCMTECDSNYPLGTQLNLIAQPSTGFIFDGWSDAQNQCNDQNNTCQLTMDRDIQLQAHFIDETEIIFTNSFE